MARSIARRDVGRAQSIPDRAPQIVATETPYWIQPKGLNYLNRASRIDPSYAWDMQNFMYQDGRLESRAGTNIQGSSTGWHEVGIFVTSDGISHLFRMTQTEFQYWNGTAWALPNVPRPVLTGGEDDHLTFTAWNDLMIVSNGKDGLWAWNWETNTIDTITTDYVPKFVTTFMSRIFLCHVKEFGVWIPTRIRWTAKNFYDNFTADGSGYEDFLSTPEGYVDRQTALIPVNDTMALAFRADSVWLVAETGSVTSPIRIGRIHAKIGTQSARTVLSIPGGAIGLFDEGIYVVDESGYKSIGDMIFRRIQERVTDFDKCAAVYDHNNRRYILLTTETSYNRSVIYHCDLDTGTWTAQIYPWRSLSLAFGQRPTNVFESWDMSTGTWDSDNVPWDLNNIGVRPGILYMSGGNYGITYFTYYEDPSNEVDRLNLGFEPESFPAITCFIVTGLLAAKNPLYETYIIDVHIEYEATMDTSVVIYWSDDLGTTWTEYSSATLVTTNGPRIFRFDRTLVGHNIQLKFQITSTPKFKLLNFVPRVVVGELVHP